MIEKELTQALSIKSLRNVKEVMSSMKDENGEEINILNPPFIFSEEEEKIIRKNYD